jgi:hypothetical protein
MPGFIRLPQVGVNGVIGHQLQGFELHAVPALQQDRLGSRQPAHRDGGSSRVVTQSLGHIARGEPIKLVDGGRQHRSSTDVSDRVSALIEVSSMEHHGRGYRNIQTRVPWIGNTTDDLDWTSRVGIGGGPRSIFATYGNEVAHARAPIDD